MWVFFFIFGIELVFRCNNLMLIGQHLSDGLDVNCVNVSIITSIYCVLELDGQFLILSII